MSIVCIFSSVGVGKRAGLHLNWQSGLRSESVHLWPPQATKKRGSNFCNHTCKYKSCKSTQKSQKHVICWSMHVIIKLGQYGTWTYWHGTPIIWKALLFPNSVSLLLYTSLAPISTFCFVDLSFMSKALRKCIIVCRVAFLCQSTKNKFGDL